MPLHEWSYPHSERPIAEVNEWGEASCDPEPVKDVTTWVFDEGSFRPAAKLMGDETYSIISDYLGTPIEMYDAKGERTWGVDYDIYGKIRKQQVGFASDCPFRYPGQYEDTETGLYYNRFRYYSPEEGMYVSQDPIGLAGGMVAYGYVRDVNSGVDVWGLSLSIPTLLTKGSVFRGVKPGQPATSPTTLDVNHFKETGNMPGISTKPKLHNQAQKFFDKIGATDIHQIDVTKLNDLEAIQDGKEHVSLAPKGWFEGKLSKEEMLSILDDWSTKGDDHPFSKELKNATVCKS